MRKLKFVVSMITRDNDYQREQARAAADAARGLGIELEVMYAESDSIVQSQQLLEVVQNTAEHVDGIVIEPAGGTAFPQIARAAAMRGLAWAVLNRGNVDYIAELRNSFHVPIVAVSSNHDEIGEIQGLQMGAILPQGGVVVYVQGPASSPVTQQRTEGMMRTKPENVAVKLLRSATWTEESGGRAIAAWLRLGTANIQPIDMVAAQNDAIARGARKALEENTQGRDRERWSRVSFIGVDGCPQTGQVWVRDGLLTATVIVPPNVVPALEALVRAVRSGAQPPERTLISPRSFPDVGTLGGRFAKGMGA